MYTTTELQNELRQSEILTGLCQHIYDPVAKDVVITPHPYVIILAQDCDLLREFETAGTLNTALVYEADTLENTKNKLPGSDVFKLVKKNQHERYHILEPVPPEFDVEGVGLPQLVIDFRRYFTSSCKEIFRQCALSDNGAKRRSRLESPFRENLQQRAASYFQRVALPETQD